jgi:hypothetical protein
MLRINAKISHVSKMLNTVQYIMQLEYHKLWCFGFFYMNK